MLLNEISLMLALKVCTPAYRIFPLYACSLEYLDTLCIGKTYEFCICHTFKALYELIASATDR